MAHERPLANGISHRSRARPRTRGTETTRIAHVKKHVHRGRRHSHSRTSFTNTHARDRPRVGECARVSFAPPPRPRTKGGGLDGESHTVTHEDRLATRHDTPTDVSIDTQAISSHTTSDARKVRPKGDRKKTRHGPWIALNRSLGYEVHDIGPYSVLRRPVCTTSVRYRVVTHGDRPNARRDRGRRRRGRRSIDGWMDARENAARET